MKVKLHKHHFDYLKCNLFNERKDLFERIQFEYLEDITCLELDDELADEIRDWSGERLQLLGFDRDYELNKEGKVLEEIIELLYL